MLIEKMEQELERAEKQYKQYDAMVKDGVDNINNWMSGAPGDKISKERLFADARECRATALGRMTLCKKFIRLAKTYTK